MISNRTSFSLWPLPYELMMNVSFFLNRAWNYVEGSDLLDLDVAASCSTQLDFIAKFKMHWASALPHSLGIPEEWKVCRVVGKFFSFG